MDKKLAQDLDRYLTTPPEDKYTSEDFIEDILDIHSKYITGIITQKEFLEEVLSAIETLE